MRGKGEGSIFKDSRGLWTATIELPPRDGQRRRKTIRSKDKATVIKKLATLRAELKNNHDLPTASETVEHWFGYWLTKVAPNSVRPKTLKNWAGLTKNWILPAIGKVKLEHLSTTHIRKVTERVAEDRAPATALLVHRILSTSLADAVSENRISINPAKRIRPPKKGTTNLDVLTTAEVRQIRELFQDSPEQYLWLTFLYTGARRGEVLGLEWDRIGDVIDFSWQLQSYTKDDFAPAADYEYRQLTDTLYLTRPKSRAGIRIIPLVEPLKGYLTRWKLETGTNPHGLVFARPNGKPFYPDVVSKWWPRVLEAAGIHKKVRLHDLRHTAIDLAYEAKTPEHLIPQLFGHSTRAQSREYLSGQNMPQLVEAMENMAALTAPKPH